MLISLSQATEPVGGYITESVMHVHGQCNATYGYLPSHIASPASGRYQFILLGEQRHMHVNNLPRVVHEAEWPGLEPATYWLQVRRPNHYATTNNGNSFIHVNVCFRVQMLGILVTALTINQHFSSIVGVKMIPPPSGKPPRPRRAYQALQKWGIGIFRLFEIFLRTGIGKKKESPRTANHPRRPGLSF